MTDVLVFVLKQAHQIPGSMSAWTFALFGALLISEKFLGHHASEDAPPPNQTGQNFLLFCLVALSEQHVVVLMQTFQLQITGSQAVRSSSASQIRSWSKFTRSRSGVPVYYSLLPPTNWLRVLSKFVRLLKCGNWGFQFWYQSAFPFQT